MKKNKNISEQQVKILAGMDKVYEKLILFKKQMNSDLVVLKGKKIVHIKPE
ncbi:hypothetical protein FLCU109888_07650 [Flavobacterium cucumis]|jgi:hypothetical protein|uniref:Uncharacterized protein n=2 Tax=Flavobacterium TaxID=237 RepID=A0A1M6CFC0_9FLAO|nr:MULTISPECIES: hypothetical protein [Flavobacterium]SHI59697.1 hypothetical protein SAMN05444337_0360 [Flavobacterium haoranii]SHO73196.1 hypothetical protein SAMN05443547_1550 [Flavobacterium cucumis]